MTNKCSVRGCKAEIAVKIHKLCRPHYMRYYSKGHPGGPYIPRKTRIKVYEPEIEEKKMEAVKG